MRNSKSPMRGERDEAAEHEREQPRVRVVRPLQQDGDGDDQEWQRVEREEREQELRDVQPRERA